MDTSSASVGVPASFLIGGGEMGERMRSFDWSKTRLGEPREWPLVLRSMVAACINSPLLGCVLWGPDLLFLYNDTYARSLADRHPHALAKPVADVWGDAWQQVKEPFLNLLKSGEGFSQTNVQLEFERRGKVETTWWDISATPIIGGDGDIAGILNQGIETTRQVRALQALQQSEADLSALNETLERQVAERTSELRFHRDVIEATISPICVFDTEYRLIAFNKAHSNEFFRIFGVWVRTGDVFPDLFPADQAPTMRAFMDRALAGESYTVVEEFGDPELSKPYWEVNYTPLRDENGRVVGAFHLANDITMRLRAEAELQVAQDALRQAQKMDAMGQLTGGVAHDFNNLLTPIIGGLEMLQRRGVGGEREQRLIGGAMQSAERAKVLVQRLLAFARRQPLQPVPVSITPLIRSMAGLIESTVGPRIEVRLDLEDDLCPAVADPNQLEMAVLNLGVNARDAMPEGGVLTISTRREQVAGPHRTKLPSGDYVRVEVSDTGTGMDQATMTRAIEPFFSTKGVGRGTGLGLSMAHGLAAQLGGTLTLASKVGRGTTIELWLPGSAEAITPEAAPTQKVSARQRGSALLVDDEAVVRMSTADMLTELGFVVVEAGSGEEALALLSAQPAPDLLVTDHLMPGMSGVDLIRRAHALYPTLPALIISGYAEVEALAPELARLVKPFRINELAERVLDVMPAAQTK